MNLTQVIIYAIIIVIAVEIIKTIAEKTIKSKSKDSEINIDTEAKKEISYTNYEKKSILTDHEKDFYTKKLKPITNKYNVHILTKVRIEDIIGVKKGLKKNEYWTARNYIKSRHFDFVLADPENLNIYAVLELDDSSHQRADTKETDKMKNELCEFVGLPIIRTNGKDTQTLENQIEDILKARKS